MAYGRDGRRAYREHSWAHSHAPQPPEVVVAGRGALSLPRSETHPGSEISTLKLYKHVGRIFVEKGVIKSPHTDHLTASLCLLDLYLNL